MAVTNRQVRVLLTGGIGAGKSTVGELLRTRGAFVIDADQVGHDVLEPGGEAFESVSATWPSVVVEGRIDRRKLAEIVFGDGAELRKLEDLTHPAIRQRIHRLVDATDADLVVVQVPLLVDFMGNGWVRVVVDAPVDVRLARLARRGSGEAKRRMAVQPAPAEWRAFADVVIDNSGDRQHLIGEVDGALRALGYEVPTDPSTDPSP